jgi:hypothetical protein
MLTQPQLFEAVQIFLTGRSSLESLCDAVDQFLADHHDQPSDKLAYALRIAHACSLAEDGVLPIAELRAALLPAATLEEFQLRLPKVDSSRSQSVGATGTSAQLTKASYPASYRATAAE